MASLGNAVTVFPVNGCDENPARVFGDMPDTVEVMHTLSFDRLAAFLDAGPNYYDTVWVARAHNLARVRPILARLTAEGLLKARIVLDTEAVTPNREAMQARLAGEVYDLPTAMQAILADADICQKVVTVTELEADTLRLFGFNNVSVIGHMVEPKPTARPFKERSGMLFVGAIHKQDSPNFDSLVWFVDEVLPLIEAHLTWETRLTIAGYIAPGVDLSRFENHPRITLTWAGGRPSPALQCPPDLRRTDAIRRRRAVQGAGGGLSRAARRRHRCPARGVGLAAGAGPAFRRCRRPRRLCRQRGRTVSR